MTNSVKGLVDAFNQGAKFSALLKFAKEANLCVCYFAHDDGSQSTLTVMDYEEASKDLPHGYGFIINTVQMNKYSLLEAIENIINKR